MAIDDRVRSVIEALGLKVILWNVDTNDWKLVGIPEADQISKITKSIQDCIAGCDTKDPNGGGIILEHDYPNAFAISDVLDLMKSTSFNLKTVSQCAGYYAYSGDWLSRILGEDLLAPTNTSTAIMTKITSDMAVSSNGTRRDAVKGNPVQNPSAGGSSGLSGTWTFLLVVLTIF